MRSQHTAHYVENITADLSNAAKGHLIGISKTLRKKEDADGDGDRIFTPCFNNDKHWKTEG